MAMPSSPAWSWTEMLGGVVWESKRVLAAHSRHFLALSVLFLLPLSSLLVASPALLLLPSLRPHVLIPPQSLLSSPLHRPPAASLALAVLYPSAALALALCATAAVIHSVQNGFFGRPVRLLLTLRSLPASLLRLLITFLAALLPIAALLTLLSSLLILSLRAIPRLHPSPPPFATPLAYSLFAAAATFALIYLQVKWSLAAVIAVIESSWGFAPLQRSAYLIRGMRRATLCLYMFFAAGIGVMLWGFSLGAVPVMAAHWSEVMPVVVRTIFGSAATALLLLYCLVTNVVMYTYCKALHGELAREIADEFASEYVFLPFDDQKVPHLVSVVRQ